MHKFCIYTGLFHLLLYNITFLFFENLKHNVFFIISTSNIVFIVQEYTAFMLPTRNDKPILRMFTNALPFDQWQSSDNQGWILQRTSGFIQRFWQNRVVNVNKKLSTLQHKGNTGVNI